MATVQLWEACAVDGETEPLGKAESTRGHDLLAEVAAGEDKLVLEDAAGGHGLGALTVRLQQFTEELLSQRVAL